MSEELCRYIAKPYKICFFPWLNNLRLGLVTALLIVNIFARGATPTPYDRTDAMLEQEGNANQLLLPLSIL
jgi:hypothetical protein